MDLPQSHRQGPTCSKYFTLFLPLPIPEGSCLCGPPSSDFHVSTTLVPSVHTWLWTVFSERVSIPLTHVAMPHQLSSPHSQWRTACASCGTCPTTCTRRYLGLTGTRRLSLGPRAVLRAPSAGGGMMLAALVARRPKVGLGYHFRTTPPCSPAECSSYP